MLRGILGLERELVTGGWREFQNLCTTKYD
jgi:hypothetical protein